MSTLDRRSFLTLAGAAGVTGVLGLTGCSSSSDGAPARGGITWWDEFQPLQALEQRTFAAYAARHRDADVAYTVYDPAGLGSALQLAQQSGRLPDVFTNGFGIPDLSLVDNGWVRPLELTPTARAAVAESLVEGLHTFDGRVYSFPLFTPRQHASLTWYDRRVVERAGGDPDGGPTSWDDFRTLARRITKQGTSGWIEGTTLVDRLRQHVVDLATGTGADLVFTENSADTPGVAIGSTGEYPFDGDAFVDVFEFLGALVRDGVMFPSSTSLDVRTARARWAGGAAGLFLDGSWNVGVLQGQFPDFAAHVGVGPMPTPDGTARARNGATGGAFWVADSAAQPEDIDAILSEMTTARYAAGMAGAMDQPPAVVDAVEHGADVPTLYRRAVGIMQDDVTVTTSPIARNPDVGAVIAEMNQIRPTLGEIAQGFLGGNVPDVRGELRSYRSRLSAERDRAIGVVRSRGRDVSVDDWRGTADDQTGSAA